MISRNSPCWCGSGKKWKKCHYPNKKSVSITEIYRKEYNIIIKTAKQIEKIKAACKIASKILKQLCKAVKIGITTNDLDKLSLELHKKYEVVPAPLGYGDPPFPKSICTSLNDVICHGIPDDTILKDGDILNIDVTVIHDGYYGDCSQMVTIGKISEEKQRVVDVSYTCLMKAIKICKPGIQLCEIGNTIEDYAQKHGCSVVNQFVGHGIGLAFHESPQIPHYSNTNNLILVPGMIFTIEPMINAGIREAVIDKKDKWTARTKDGKPSAQWEHTILITDTSHEILTQ